MRGKHTEINGSDAHVKTGSCPDRDEFESKIATELFKLGFETEDANWMARYFYPEPRDGEKSNGWELFSDEWDIRNYHDEVENTLLAIHRAYPDIRGDVEITDEEDDYRIIEFRKNGIWVRQGKIVYSKKGRRFEGGWAA